MTHISIYNNFLCFYIELFSSKMLKYSQNRHDNEVTNYEIKFRTLVNINFFALIIKIEEVNFIN